MWIYPFLLFMYFQSILCLTCTETEFYCKHSGSCVPTQLVCNGVRDCNLGEDEHDCPLVCKEGEMKCVDGHRCVSNNLKCDGFNDCDDGTDEISCPDGVVKYHTCDPDHFSCPGDHFCLPDVYKCDGHADCEQGEDEQNCEGVPLKNNDDCPHPNYKCEDSEETCIAARHVCDGEHDCLDGSDEHHCGIYTLIPDCLITQGRFACKDEFGSNEVMCLELSHLCDGKPQCPLNEDEGDFCGEKTCSTQGCQHDCVQTPEGAQCLCSVGYKLSEDGLSCVDVDECLEYGICDQICTNTEGSYECSCKQEYSLQGKSYCQYMTGFPEMFITSFNDFSGEIRSYNPLTREYLLLVENLTLPIGVGYDEINNALIWTDSHADHPVVESAVLKSSKVEVYDDIKTTIVETGLEMPMDLVVDSLSKLAYFTDFIKGTVSVCNFETINCSVISPSHFKPSGLAIHSKKKLLFVTEHGEDEDTPKIAGMSQDGSNSRNIITLKPNSKPNGIFVDESTDRIFWTDSYFGTINSANLDGSDIRIVVQDFHQPFGVVVFENRVYWTDWQYYVLRSANKFTGNDIKTELKSTKWQLNGLHLHIAKNVQEDESTDPCKDNLCSHLCLPRGLQEFTCACPEGMFIGIGGTSCRAPASFYYPFHSRIFVSSESSILSMTPQKLGLIDLETVGFESGLVTSVSSETVANNLLAATSNKDLVVVNTDRKSSKVIATGQEVKSLSYDHTNFNIFWIDISKNTIMVMSESTKAIKTLVNCTHPKSVHYVHIKHKLAYIDGTNLLEIDMKAHQINLLVSHLPENSTGLVYDENAYYFADEHFIYRFNEGSSTFADVSRIKSKPLSLVTQGGYIYWTLENSNKLYWIDQESDIVNGIVYSLTLKALEAKSLHLSASRIFEDTSMGACSNKYCSDICVVTEDDVPHCLCGDGRSIVPDQEWNTCKSDSSETSEMATKLMSLSKEYIGLIVSISMVLVFTGVLLCGCCVFKRKGSSPREFINRSFGSSPKSSKKGVKEMSPVSFHKNGSLNEMYNPSYYSISLAACPPIATSHTPVSAPTFSTSFQTEQEKTGFFASIMRGIRKFTGPKMSQIDLGVNPNTSYESLASSKSGSFKRKMETIDEYDSACSMGQNSMEDDISVCSDTEQLVNKY